VSTTPSRRTLSPHPCVTSSGFAGDEKRPEGSGIPIAFPRDASTRELREKGGGGGEVVRSPLYIPLFQTSEKMGLGRGGKGGGGKEDQGKTFFTCPCHETPKVRRGCHAKFRKKGQGRHITSLSLPTRKKKKEGGGLPSGRPGSFG